MHIALDLVCCQFFCYLDFWRLVPSNEQQVLLSVPKCPELINRTPLLILSSSTGFRSNFTSISKFFWTRSKPSTISHLLIRLGSSTLPLRPVPSNLSHGSFHPPHHVHLLCPRLWNSLPPETRTLDYPLSLRPNWNPSGSGLWLGSGGPWKD